MDAQPQNIIPSGIEPVDSVMGGLESGELYFVHGEASGKSLFGISFLIEGLKRGEHGALVIRSSPEDAVNRFARIGYDCLEDVYGGRLVIIESSDHLIRQTTGPAQLAPALRELEWLLGASRPRRLVFDPVTSEAVSDRRGLEARVGEFAQWTRQLGATVLLIANEDNSQIAELFKRHVAESFRFEVRDAPPDRAMPFISFEKSLTLPARPIQVDPSRGIFLSERVEGAHISPTFFSTSGADSRLVDIDSPAQKPSQARPIAAGLETTAPKTRRDYTVGRINEMAPLELDLKSIDDAVARLVEHKDQNGAARPQQFLAGPPQHPDETCASERDAAEELDLTSELFGELTGVIFPGDLSGGQASHLQSSDVPPMTNQGSEQASRPLAQKAPERRRDSDRASNQASSRQDTSAEPTVAGSSRPQPAKRARASDLRIEAAMAASAVDSLLGRSKTAKTPPEPAPSVAPAEAAAAQNSVDAKSFKVLVINDDAEPCEIIVQSLMDFTIEQTNDGVSGLAGLISYKPDLVVLDLDIPIVDGFKVLAHIRASLNVPVIIVSSTLAQQSDRLRATESETESAATMDQLSKALAASGYYHLTRAFSTKELRDKARQLIARYRGVDAWIISPPARVSETAHSIDTRAHDQPDYAVAQDQHQSVGAQGDWLTPYDAFVMELERRVKAVIDNGSALSLVGCRVPQMPRTHDEIAQFRLREVIRDVVRDTDLASANAPGEVVILLADARASGARAFASRLRETVAQKMNQEPSVWMRSFPELEETREAATASAKPTNGNVYRRRASDRQARA